MVLNTNIYFLMLVMCKVNIGKNLAWDFFGGLIFGPGSFKRFCWKPYRVFVVFFLLPFDLPPPARWGSSSIKIKNILINKMV